MKIQKIAAIVLIVIGALGLAYGGFSYTSDMHRANVGSLSLSVAEKEQVNIPIWAGLTMVLVGGVLLISRKVI